MTHDPLAVAQDPRCGFPYCDRSASSGRTQYCDDPDHNTQTAQRRARLARDEVVGANAEFPAAVPNGYDRDFLTVICAGHDGYYAESLPQWALPHNHRSHNHRSHNDLGNGHRWARGLLARAAHGGGPTLASRAAVQQRIADLALTYGHRVKYRIPDLDARAAIGYAAVCQVGVNLLGAHVAAQHVVDALGRDPDTAGLEELRVTAADVVTVIWPGLAHTMPTAPPTADDPGPGHVGDPTTAGATLHREIARWPGALDEPARTRLAQLARLGLFAHQPRQFAAAACHLMRATAADHSPDTPQHLHRAFAAVYPHAFPGGTT